MKSELVPRIRFGEFEEPWEQHTLGQYFEFKNGINADKEQYGSGIKFINVSDILNNSYLTHDVIEGSVDVAEDQIAKYEVKYGDILFQRSSETRLEVGSANVYLDKLNRAVFGGFVIRGQAKRPYDPEFMNYLLKTSSARKDITSRSGGSTRYNIGQESIAASSVHLPTLPEQQKVAAFLTAVDGRLAGLRRQVAALERYKRGVMQGVFDRKKIHGKQYEFGNIAKRSKSRLDPRKSSRSYPCVELESLSQNTGSILETFDSAEQRSIKNKFVAGQVLFGKLRPYLNKYARPDFDGVCSSEIWVLEGLKVSDEYLFYLIQSDGFRRAATVSAGSKMPRASWDVVSSATFAVPSDSEQRRIATFLRALDARIGLVERQLAGAEAFKRGLLQQMFV